MGVWHWWRRVGWILRARRDLPSTEKGGGERLKIKKNHADKRFTDF